MSLTQGLEQMKRRADAAMKIKVHDKALELQGYMQTHRKWQDRSGAARQRLTGTSVEQDNGFLIKLAHGVDYGVFLELAHEKKFAITVPTAKEKGPEVIASFEGLLDSLKKDL